MSTVQEILIQKVVSQVNGFKPLKLKPLAFCIESVIEIMSAAMQTNDDLYLNMLQLVLQHVLGNCSISMPTVNRHTELVEMQIEFCLRAEQATHRDSAVVRRAFRIATELSTHPTTTSTPHFRFVLTFA